MSLGGRPPELTPELHEAIIADIADAIPYEYAAGANGIATSTLYNWKARGEKEQAEGLNTIYTRFLEGIKKAERNRIRKHLGKIDDHEKDWVCDAWILERRWWEHYGKNAPLIEFKKQLDEMKASMEKDDGK